MSFAWDLVRIQGLWQEALVLPRSPAASFLLKVHIEFCFFVSLFLIDDMFLPLFEAVASTEIILSNLHVKKFQLLTHCTTPYCWSLCNSQQIHVMSSFICLKLCSCLCPPDVSLLIFPFSKCLSVSCQLTYLCFITFYQFWKYFNHKCLSNCLSFNASQLVVFGAL